MAGHCYDFRRGYEITRKRGRHETAEQFRAFQEYLRMGKRSLDEVAKNAGKLPTTIRAWSKNYNWEYRAAQWDKEQVKLTFNKAEKLREKTHKRSIMEFRDASERQARMMMEISEDLLEVLIKRVKDALANDETLPLSLVSGLMKATAALSDQSRQSWAAALGVEDMLQIVEQEIEKVEIQEVNEDDDIIEIDE
jgi:transposase-like protein